jgi:lipopolysaccharide/colanic/teichoic acid biosynthesis glycosyltransferase
MPKSWERPALARLRWQLPLTLIAAVLVPAALLLWSYSYEQFWLDQSLFNTLVLSAACSFCSLLFFRRLEQVPGMSTFAQIAPSVALAYGTGLAIILLLRLEYSRPLLFLSMACSLLGLGALWVYYRHRCVATVYLLPGARLSPSRRLKVQLLASPAEEIDRHSLVAADLQSDLSPRWQRFLLRSALAGVPVYHAKSLEESISGKVAVDHLSENTFGSVIPSSRYQNIKRAMDLTIALLAMPFLIVLFGLIALAIRLDSPGAVFFKQARVGFRGQSFRMVKFRTMRQSCDVASNASCAVVAMTQHGDPRITRVGRFLRKHRIDELPQVLNIIRGEMSWIGPRPEALALSRMYDREIPFYGYRHMVRPGITGWAQVCQGHVVDVTDVRDKLNYDFYYIKNFSGWLDALIAARTFRILLFGAGAK